jgi:threonylcarbamoyladenosine tRNA methylthiotransferase MtaB
MKVFLDTVGCRLNQAEIESMARQFRAAGHEIVEAAERAELAVVNTCAVTVQAASDSRGRIRSLARAGNFEIIVTGCWATLQSKSAAALPHVSRVVLNASKDNLVADALGLPQPVFDREPLARAPLPGLRHRTRAFIKVQDGCNNRCTFCVTTLARGRSRSRPLGTVVGEIQAALNGGAKEIVLTGVHLGAWGQDLGLTLRDLVRALLADTAVPRLRLSSLEPWDLDEDFFALWDDQRLCRHLHLPLQSGAAATLRRMDRRTSPGSFRALVQAARQAMPEVAITTDVIAGFPGESVREFEESLEFVRETEFAGGHAFSFSPRAGTSAARFQAQVDPGLRKLRSRTYRALFDEAALAYRRKFIGTTTSVLWESEVPVGNHGWLLEGHTGNYLRVAALAPVPRWNEMDLVELHAVTGRMLSGIILKSG